MPRTTPPISLALQGGGAHGAFTWGVLDALLEKGVPVAAASGASAGALNAVMLAAGLVNGCNDDARAALERFWLAIARTLTPTAMPVPNQIASTEPPAWAPWAEAWMQWTHWFSPTQLNPLNLNPLREVLREHVDFDQLQRKAGPALFVAATNAQTGQLRLFRRTEVTLDVLLASTCLPMVAHAVHIDGQAHWDGGFSANPPLWPLLREVAADDLLLVTLSPLKPQPVPVDAAGIESRMREIAMTAPFLREARLLAEQQADALAHWWRWGLDRRLARLRWHHIGGDETLAALPGSSRWLPEESFVLGLKEQGRQHAAAWWQQHGSKVGKQSSFDALTCFGQPR